MVTERAMAPAKVKWRLLVGLISCTHSLHWLSEIRPPKCEGHLRKMFSFASPGRANNREMRFEPCFTVTLGHSHSLDGIGACRKMAPRPCTIRIQGCSKNLRARIVSSATLFDFSSGSDVLCDECVPHHRTMPLKYKIWHASVADRALDPIHSQGITGCRHSGYLDVLVSNIPLQNCHQSIESSTMRLITGGASWPTPVDGLGFHLKVNHCQRRSLFELPCPHTRDDLAIHMLQFSGSPWP